MNVTDLVDNQLYPVTDKVAYQKVSSPDLAISNGYKLKSKTSIKVLYRFYIDFNVYDLDLWSAAGSR